MTAEPTVPSSPTPDAAIQREKTGDPAEPGPPRPRDEGDAPVPRPRDRRAVLRPAHLHGLPDVLLGAWTPRRSSGRRSTASSTPRKHAEADQRRHRVRPRLDDRARRLHVRHQRRVADPVAPARPPSGRRRVRPAEPALRQVQGRLDDAAGTRSPRRDPELRERYEEQIDGSLELYGDLVGAGIPGEDARFVFPNATRTNLVMTTNLRALIHMSRAAPVHDGPVGDPPAVPADPPRDLRRCRRSSARSSPRSACRSATATRWTTATSTARSGRTRTASSAAWAEKAKAAKAAGRELPVR